MKKIFKILIPLILILIIAFIFLFKDKAVIELPYEEMTIEVFADYEIPQAKGFYKNRDISKDLEIENNINNQKIGEYEIIYSYKSFLNKTSEKIKVKVIDTVAPIVRLNNGNIFLIKKGEIFNDPGVIAVDNYDEEVIVEIDGNVDINQEGIYALTYHVKDTSGNESVVFREVLVGNKSEEEFEPSIYKIESNNKTKYHEPYDEYKMLQYGLAGDSNMQTMMYNMFFNSYHTMAKPCLGPSNFFYETCTYKNEESGLTAIDILNQNKENFPSLYLNIGLCDCELISYSDFTRLYEELINYLLDNYPDMNLGIISLIPMARDDLAIKPPNITINIYNDYLLAIAEKYDLPFIDVASVLKDEKGLGNSQYYDDDGYHLNELGQKIFQEYLRSYLP